ncbi:MAG: DUF4159 domain-containing protein [Planctomycetaceae bacterium]
MLAWRWRGIFALWLMGGLCLAQPGNGPTSAALHVDQPIPVATESPVFGQIGNAPRRSGFRSDRVPAPYRVTDRNGVPTWERHEVFPDDAFTFARIIYNADGGRGGGKWQTDYPDADLNFSFRLQQLTALNVDPDPVVLDLAHPELFNYPFIYLIEPGGYRGAWGTGMNLTEAEVEGLQRYLANGGFLMVDDFWGDDEWAEFEREFRRVIGEREIVELPLDHEIFHCVYDLTEKPQIPAINQALQGRASGVSWEGGLDGRDPHYRGVFDDAGRLMALICHNTDLGDGWEREGEHEWYFREFSEKRAYPLGINILFYTMSH